MEACGASASKRPERDGLVLLLAAALVPVTHPMVAGVVIGRGLSAVMWVGALHPCMPRKWKWVKKPVRIGFFSFSFLCWEKLADEIWGRGAMHTYGFDMKRHNYYEILVCCEVWIFLEGMRFYLGKNGSTMLFPLTSFIKMETLRLLRSGDDIS